MKSWEEDSVVAAVLIWLCEMRTEDVNKVEGVRVLLTTKEPPGDDDFSIKGEEVVT